MNDLCKECVNCKTVRPRNEFHKQQGATGWCKPCKEAGKTKVCNKCHECKPYSEYYKHRDGVMARCKTCTQSSIGSQAKWTDANNGVIRALYPEGGANACQIAMPTRSIASINQQAHRLGVRYEFTGRDGEQKYLAGMKPNGTPLPFQDTAAQHKEWQTTRVPTYVTGNLCARLAANWDQQEMAA